MTLTTTTAQTLTSPNPKRQLPKRLRLQQHQRKQLQKRRRALGRKTTLQSQKSRKQLQRRKRTLTVTTCREVILTSRTWSQQGTDQVVARKRLIMVEATQGAAVTATSKKSALRHFEAQLDLKSFHDDAWAQ